MQAIIKEVQQPQEALTASMGNCYLCRLSLLQVQPEYQQQLAVLHADIKEVQQAQEAVSVNIGCPYHDRLPL